MLLSAEYVNSIAIEIRNDFENGKINERYVSRLIKNYTPYLIDALGDDFDLWIKQSLDSFPVNSCEIATVVLLDRLGEGKIVYGRHGYDPKPNENARRSHTIWAQCEGDQINLIADVTADQFGGPTVYVGPLVEPWSTPDWDLVVDK